MVLCVLCKFLFQLLEITRLILFTISLFLCYTCFVFLFCLFIYLFLPKGQLISKTYNTYDLSISTTPAEKHLQSKEPKHTLSHTQRFYKALHASATNKHFSFSLSSSSSITHPSFSLLFSHLMSSFSFLSEQKHTCFYICAFLYKCESHAWGSFLLPSVCDL